MSNYVKLATDAGDQYLASLAEIQESFLKATTAFASTLTPVTSVITPPAFAAADVPSAQELTEASFAFAQKLLKQQKSFAEKMLAASTPTTK
ncbi:MAG: hypothetical protein EHM50_02540 [Lysobacterales bacterium]|nr:MAG: hypothetical protein EHM50_02540 [Xanthomonadales bacterium]